LILDRITGISAGIARATLASALTATARRPPGNDATRRRITTGSNDVEDGADIATDRHVG
jgi:hypothetical protein